MKLKTGNAISFCYVGNSVQLVNDVITTICEYAFSLVGLCLCVLSVSS